MNNTFYLTTNQREHLKAFVDVSQPNETTLQAMTDCLHEITKFTKPYYKKGMRLDEDDMVLVDKVCNVHMETETTLENRNAFAKAQEQLKAIHPKLGE